MIEHLVDPTARVIASDDLATWLLFYLEAHGAAVTLGPMENIEVNLDPVPGLTAAVVDRWAPICAILLPEFREILQARR